MYLQSRQNTLRNILSTLTLNRVYCTGITSNHLELITHHLHSTDSNTTLFKALEKMRFLDEALQLRLL